jgi:Uma2 family endonuclease
MGMSVPIYYSADLVRALPDDGKRYETVHGELLVTPAPSALHQEVILRLIVLLDAYLKREPVGKLFQSPADISWGDDVLVQPDLFVVEPGQGRSLDWSRMKDLLLAIEVLSPTTARHDRFTKRRLYQEVGIPVYWIVDPVSRAAEVWTPEASTPRLERETLAWRPPGAQSSLRIPLADLFPA